MGLYDRDYTQPESRRRSYDLSQMRFNLPRMTPAVKWLLIINAVVFALSLVPAVSGFLASWLAIDTRTWTAILQPWRLLTYQFLHKDAWHIFMNMIGLFLIAPPLERFWGSRRFVLFYLGCGVAGALAYISLALVGWLGVGLMVGASGAVLGVVAACAVLFPHFTLIVFVFPVPIRIAAVGLMVVYLVNVLTAYGHGGAGGDAAHLGGMAAGLAYVLVHPTWDRFRLKMRSGSWEKRIEDSRRLQIEVDRLLAKVHHAGLHSLTRREKTTLKRATQEELRRHHL